jgi:basic membrane protein A
MNRQSMRAYQRAGLTVRRVGLSACFIALVSVVGAGCGSSSSTTSNSASASTTSSAQAHPTKLEVAFLYSSPHNDGGWSEAHDQARIALQNAFPGKVTTVYKDSVPESPQAAQVIASLIQGGANVIVATSQGYATYIAQAASAHPDVHFLQLQSTQLAPNLSEYNAALEDPAYLAGMVAAAASKTGHLGIDAEFPVPSVTNDINGYALGAKAINPNATVRVVWTNSWYNPPSERTAAASLISSGVDVLAQNENSSATASVAESDGVPFIGSFWHQQQFAPKEYLTSPIYTWADFYISEIRSIFNGTWKSNSTYLTMATHGVALDKFGPLYYKLVSTADQAKIAAVEKRLEAGTFNIYTGPIYDTHGKLRVPAGQTLPLSARFAMNWFVSNVQTSG